MKKVGILSNLKLEMEFESILHLCFEEDFVQESVQYLVIDPVRILVAQNNEQWWAATKYY